MEDNAMGGYQYSEANEKIRAKNVDLITLPVLGTNCGNCKFFKREGYCNNPQVQLPVTKKMCCAVWKNNRQLNSWE